MLGAGHIPPDAARPGVGAGAPLKPSAPKENFPDTHQLPLGSRDLTGTRAEVRLGSGMLRAVVTDPQGIRLRVTGPALGCIFAMKAFPWIKHPDPLQGFVFATCPMPVEPP